MPSFSQQLLEAMRGAGESDPELSREEAGRLERLAQLSPLYRNLLLHHPDWLPWILQEPLKEERLLAQSIANAWTRFADGASVDSPDYLARLRLFRRRFSLRVAYREINRLYHERQSTLELSLLAEFNIRECLHLAMRKWESRHGEPWDGELDRPARFCVLGLGKLGGHELNFSSDIDLIYCYEGEGHCRLDGKPGQFTSAQFFTKVAETTSSLLQEQTGEGFLHRVDLRLRPEGAGSSVVRSLAGMENYYAAAGQTWERMALIKARPVAGDLSLGAELLENLHSFRYPRHPPPSLIGEIAAMKTRTEREVVGNDNLHRNVKSGYGGIREIEFIVQTMQLLHAGRYPFLQTRSTVEGLDQLTRYHLMNQEDSVFLAEAYWFLRAVEHRLQIRGEQQTHTLPSDGEILAAIASGMGFGDTEAFLRRLEETREGVRSRYGQLLNASPVDEAMDGWWRFFSGQTVTPAVSKSLDHWFGNGREGDPGGDLRDFVQGSRHALLTRGHVSRFTSLVPIFDRVMPELAFPLSTLRRISRFAASYGSRPQFLSTCSLDPNFFQVLALLFDRSVFIHGLILQHPEILEEVIRPEMLRRRKTMETLLRELERGAPAEGFDSWLWLYVKAEQVRIAIGDLLGFMEVEETEIRLSELADAVLKFLLRRLDPEESLLIVALGKYGGSELTFGSDLDLLFMGGGKHPEKEERTVRRLVQALTRREALGPVFETDLRLRPHGIDGPLAPSLPALRRYHGEKAQAWEKQVLTRARVVAGNPRAAEAFAGFVEETLYRTPAPQPVLAELWSMRLRIERERDRTDPPERAFKTGPGGLIDLEFIAQFYQMVHGAAVPDLRQPNTRLLLRTIGEKGLMDAGENETLRDNFKFLKRVEVLLRRNKNAPVSIIGDSPEEQQALARWSGFPSFDAFWPQHCRRMTTTRGIVANSLRSNWNLSVEGA